MTITITGSNDAPTLTEFAAAIGAVNTNSQATITLANLIAQGDEADVDGMVAAFVIKAVSSGTLLIGAEGAVTPWAVTTNDTVDATHNAYWTGALNESGTLEAFTAVAKDNIGLESAMAIQARMSVIA